MQGLYSMCLQALSSWGIYLDTEVDASDCYFDLEVVRFRVSNHRMPIKHAYMWFVAATGTHLQRAQKQLQWHG